MICKKCKTTIDLKEGILKICTFEEQVHCATKELSESIELLRTCVSLCAQDALRTNRNLKYRLRHLHLLEEYFFSHYPSQFKQFEAKEKLIRIERVKLRHAV